MSDHDAREKRLATIGRWAREIPETLGILHERHGRQVHLRPTTGGVTLLGLTLDRPQRGKGGFCDMQRLRDNFDQLYEQHCVATGHRRATSEKAVQSALIRDAYEHGRSMRLFDTATAPTNDAVAPIFVVDELSLPDAGGEICCDLVALRPIAPETYRPVVIELKWTRQKKRLIEQVTRYADLVEEHRGSFELIAQSLLARPVRLVGECDRWIVWPALEERDSEPWVPDFAAHQIRVFTYWWAGSELRLRAWAAPPSR